MANLVLFGAAGFAGGWILVEATTLPLHHAAGPVIAGWCDVSRSRRASQQLASNVNHGGAAR